MKDNVTPAPVKVGAVDVALFKNLARMVEEGGQASRPISGCAKRPSNMACPTK
jgi:hypothetical protein